MAGSIKREVYANYISQVWSAVMALAFIPLYIKYLGVEAYGLIGLYTLLQAWLMLLDVGLLPTISREMAMLRGGGRNVQQVRNLLRSVEIVYCAVNICITSALWCFAEPIASKWLKITALDPQTVIYAVRVMAAVVGARWFEQLYRGSLQGLHDQLWLSGTQMGLATARWGGACLVAYLSGSIMVFFIWQAAVSVAAIVILNRRTYSVLPVSDRKAIFSLGELSRVLKFATGMFTSSILMVVLTQGDKLLLSKLLPLASFGIYMLAANAANGLIQLITPLNTVLYPRLTAAAAGNQLSTLRRLYHVGAEVMAFATLPIACTMAAFPRPVLYVWSGDQNIAGAAAPLLSLLVIGTALNALMNVPHLLQLSFGWVSLSNWINCCAIGVIIPSAMMLVPRYGAIAAAWLWVIVNAFYIVVTAQLMHRRLLPSEKRKWYRDGIVKPIVVCGGSAVLLRMALSLPTERWWAALSLAGVLTMIYIISALSSTSISRELVRMIASRKFNLT